MSKQDVNSLNGVYIEPKGDDPKDGGAGMCTLSVAFVIVGALSFLAGVLCAANLRDLGWLYLIVGVWACMLDLALAVIVDACDKYRKSHKG